MRNKNFMQASLPEKRSKLARVLKGRTSLSDEEIINAVTKVDLSKQYSIIKESPEGFKEKAVNSEEVIKKVKNWEEKILRNATVLIATDNGGICIIEEVHIGCMDLNKSERSYSILIY